MANQIPPFLDLVGEALVFNQEGKELVFMVPEVFFNANSKNSIAQISGEYLSTIGLFDYYIIDSNGKKSELRPFRFPTIFLSKPNRIEKAKNVIVEDFDNEGEDVERTEEEEDALSKDYRLVHFKKGDEVVHQVRVPKIIDNVELFFKLTAITAKIPTSISYNDGWELFLENARLNGLNYGLNVQLFGLLWAGICRDKNNIAKPFRLTNMKNPHDYKPVSVKMLPNFTGIFSSIISENFDESLRSAILLKDTPEEELPTSPLEKIVMQ